MLFKIPDSVKSKVFVNASHITARNYYNQLILDLNCAQAPKISSTMSNDFMLLALCDT